MSQVGELLAEGKTKSVHEWTESADLALLRNKSQITAHDDPSFTRQFHSKAIHATNTTCAVFELLKNSGIPVSFVRQHSETEFIAYRSQMLPLEIVARRYAVGSYLKRHPHAQPADPKKPKRFHTLETEFFLKTVGSLFNGQKYPTDDPMLRFPANKAAPVDGLESEELWDVVHPKVPAWESGAVFGQVKSFDVLVPGVQPSEELRKAKVTANIAYLDDLVRRVFLVLEKAWNNLGFTLIDMKIEVDSEGRVADVIDSDSWRLWKNGEAFDKQVFRDGGEAVLGEVELKYGFIANMAKRLQVPSQVIFYWDTTGDVSNGEDFPTILANKVLPGVETIAWNKTFKLGDSQILTDINDVFYRFPQGGVVVIKEQNTTASDLVGNYSPFPVISLNARPSEAVHTTSALVAGNPQFAVRQALHFLAQTNPAIYARVVS